MRRWLGLCGVVGLLCAWSAPVFAAPKVSKKGAKPRGALSPGERKVQKRIRSSLRYVQENLIVYRYKGMTKGAGFEKNGRRMNLFNVKKFFEDFPRSLRLIKEGEPFLIASLAMLIGSPILMGVGTGVMVFSLASGNGNFDAAFATSMILLGSSLIMLMVSVILLPQYANKLYRAIEEHNREVFRRAALPDEPGYNKTGRRLPAPAGGRASALAIRF